MSITEIIGYILLILFDFSIVPSFRTALFDCFRCNGYNKTYKKINENQPVLSRITLNYMYPLLKKYKRDFLIVHRCYKLYLIVSSLLYLLVPFLHFMFGKTVGITVIIFCCLFKFLVALVIRIILFPHGDVSARSVFIKKSRK